MTVKVLLIDDHQIVLEGIQSYLENHDTIELVGTAADGLSGLEMAMATRPDIVIVDITLPGMNGIDMTRTIRTNLEDTKVCALSMHTDRKYIISMIEAGACGYVAKSDPVDELVNAILSISAGGMYFSEMISKSIPEGAVSSKSDRRKDILSLLSDMDRQVLQFVAEGMSSKQIATQLHCTKKTIDYHRQNIMRKLGITSVAGLTKFAVKEGITTLEQE